MIPSFNSGMETFLLLILLISAFVVAFKIMEMVFETILVSFMSGIFYLLMVYLFGMALSLERILLFAFLGATLYMSYSIIISAYAITRPILRLPIRMVNSFFNYLRELFSLEKDSEREKSWNDYKETVSSLLDSLGSIFEKLKESVSDNSPEYKNREEYSGQNEDADEKGSERDMKEVVLKKVNEDKDED